MRGPKPSSEPAELVAEIERLERLWNGQRKSHLLRGTKRQAPTLFEVARRLDQIDQEWRLRLLKESTIVGERATSSESTR